MNFIFIFLVLFLVIFIPGFLVGRSVSLKMGVKIFVVNFIFCLAFFYVLDQVDQPAVGTFQKLSTYVICTCVAVAGFLRFCYLRWLKL